jgi:hypothetical protein
VLTTGLRHFLESFTANIRNLSTRAAYSVAVQRFFGISKTCYNLDELKQ